MVVPAAVSNASAEADGGTVTILVQQAVGESDWNLGEHAAIHHVTARRAQRRGVSIEQQAREYSAVFRSDTPRTRWVRALEPTCQEPTHWPSNASWPRYQERCRQAFGAARAFLKGELRDTCPGATHFGGMKLPADRERITRMVRAKRWVIVRCEVHTGNTYMREAR